MNNRASLQLGGGNWAAKDANLLAYETDLSEKNFLPIELGFERGSNLAATRVNSSGLIEKGRENLFLQSNQFDTTWSLLNSQVTSGQSGYDGSSDAWLLERSGGGYSVFIRSTTIAASGICTISIYAKAGNSNWIAIQDSGASNVLCYFDLSNGTIGNSSPALIDRQITSVGNGWYRCSITTNRSSGVVQFYVATADLNLTGPSDAALYIQDAQFEQGLVATDYIETGASTAQAGLLEDEPRINYSGSTPSLLLEPSRTNFVTNSEYLTGTAQITSYINNGLSPEGKTNATLIQGDGTTIQPRYPENVTTTAGENILSVFAKSGNNDFVALGFQSYAGGSGTAYSFFDLANGTTPTAGAKIENYGNGWYRCISPPYTVDAGDTSGINTVFLTPSTSSLNFSSAAEANGKNVLIYGLQLERGSYPTSYIPTYGAVATRSDDYYSNTSLSNIGSTDRCTFYCEIDLPQGREGSSYFFRFDSPDSSFAWKGNYVPSPIISVIGTGNITTSGTITLSTGVHKLIVRWENGVGSIFIDGVKKTEQVKSSTTEVFDEFRSQGTGYRHLQKSVLVFPEALSDAECITLTTP